VRNAIAAVPGVLEVHDLHVWTISSGMESLSAHVIAQRDRAAARACSESCRNAARRKFGSHHADTAVEDEHAAQKCITPEPVKPGW